MYKNSPFYVVWADIWAITSFMAAAEWNEQIQGGTTQQMLILVTKLTHMERSKCQNQNICQKPVPSLKTASLTPSQAKDNDR